MLTYVAVGHLCVDELHDEPTRLGGTVFFAARQAAAMGSSVRIVTRCTADTADRARKELPDGVDLDVVPADHDTRFGFGPQAEDGPLRLTSRAPAVEAVTGPAADVLHLAPVFAELTPALVASAREHGRFVGATPQGFLRGTDDHGGLVVDTANWPALSGVADAIVLNDAEYRSISGAGLLDDYPGWVFRTRGPDGASLYREGALAESVDLADSPPVVPDHTIGAGDVFAAAAFCSLAGGAAPGEALAVAVRSATAYVRR